jgi:hypothetical protein
MVGWPAHRSPALRFRHADGAACHARAGVPRRLRLQVIRARMHDDAVPDDGVRAVKRDHGVYALVVRLAGSVRFEIAEVTGMPHGCIGTAMLHVMGIEVTARRGCIGRAAVAELVNVETVQAGSQALHVGHDFYPAIDLRERHRAGRTVKRLKLFACRLRVGP